MSTKQPVRWRVILILILFLFLVALMFHWSNGGKHGSSTASPADSEIVVTEGATSSALVQPKEPPSKSIEAAPQTTNAPDNRMQIAAASKNVPIDFWGKVIDEQENPLHGVTVRAHARRWGVLNGFAGTDNPKVSAVSGVDGRFEIHGINGDILTVDSLEKENYEVEPGALRGYGFNLSENVSVDQDHPVIFKMWNKEAHESLISGKKFFKIVPDGRIYSINLFNETVSEKQADEGDLVLSIKRQREIHLGEHYDWEFEIKPVNGGLLEEPSKYDSMYSAPAAGYTNSYRRSFFASDQHWSDGLTGKRFYIKTRGGIYGRIEIEVYASYGTNGESRFWIAFTVNPSGSRVLR